MAILIDTSVLAAHAFVRDKNHSKAVEFINDLGDELAIVIVPVLSELFYFMTVRLNYAHAVTVFATTCAAFEIEPLAPEDTARMKAIMSQYVDTRLDFTDTAIMAVSERLDITRIATFDRRDFSVYRPRHCDFYDLLPQ